MVPSSAGEGGGQRPTSLWAIARHANFPRSGIGSSGRSASCSRPTSASRLNQVEQFFGTLTEKQPRRGCLRSIQDQERSLRGYVRTCHPATVVDADGRGDFQEGGAHQAGAAWCVRIVTISCSTLSWIPVCEIQMACDGGLASARQGIFESLGTGYLTLFDCCR